jgi:hypothetical protein
MTANCCKLVACGLLGATIWAKLSLTTSHFPWHRDLCAGNIFRGTFRPSTASTQDFVESWQGCRCVAVFEATLKRSIAFPGAPYLISLPQHGLSSSAASHSRHYSYKHGSTLSARGIALYLLLLVSGSDRECVEHLGQDKTGVPKERHVGACGRPACPRGHGLFPGNDYAVINSPSCV